MFFKQGLIAVLCASLIALTAGVPTLSRAETMFEVPLNYKLLGEFAPTFYRILDERAAEWDMGEERTEELRTRNGEMIARVAPSFRHQLDIEGSARLRDGRVVNFDRKQNDEWRYVIALDAPYGLGVESYKLIPYRTLAVDPKVITQGAVLYVPLLVGVKLPTGEVHDGFCFAHDVGQDETVQGKRIDIFVGFEDDVDNTLTRSKRIANMEPLQVYAVDEGTAARLNERFEREFARPER